MAKYETKYIPKSEVEILGVNNKSGTLFLNNLFVSYFSEY